MIETKLEFSVDREQEQIKIEKYQTLLNGTWYLMSTEILNLKEEKIREALISLGWTPPQDK